ncbi:MAG: hypothetical protein FWF56_06335 [Firmicutes bacterium]|nr:hypothetical protein [Bacillota bacterium]MCL1953957.1 hypothetical protein [Bacillota bacterium]
MAVAKKQNLLIRYLTPFGLKQFADFLMVVASILIIVGLNTNQTVMTVAIVIYIVASLIAIIKCLTIVLGGINKHSPVYKGAKVNLIIMVIIFLISVLTLIYCMLYYYV